MTDLSVVIPVYNEEQSLPPLWEERRGVLGWRVRLVRLKVNAGETAATAAGFKSARGRLGVTMDADLQNDPHDIPGLLAHRDHADAVTGWRVNRQAGDSLVRRISSRVANRVRNGLYRGFHRFNYEIAEDLGGDLIHA